MEINKFNSPAFDWQTCFKADHFVTFTTFTIHPGSSDRGCHLVGELTMVRSGQFSGRAYVVGANLEEIEFAALREPRDLVNAQCWAMSVLLDKAAKNKDDGATETRVMKVGDINFQIVPDPLCPEDEIWWKDGDGRIIGVAKGLEI